eukprot:594327-Pleurochrysis_carterae.AAC.8
MLLDTYPQQCCYLRWHVHVHIDALSGMPTMATQVPSGHVGTHVVTPGNAHDRRVLSLMRERQELRAHARAHARRHP